MQNAFSLSLQSPFPEKPVALGDIFYVFQLLARQQGPDALDETKRDQLREQLLASVQNELLTGWLAWMQSEADVWVNEQIIQ